MLFSGLELGLGTVRAQIELGLYGIVLGSGGPRPTQPVWQLYVQHTILFDCQSPKVKNTIRQTWSSGYWTQSLSLWTVAPLHHYCTTDHCDPLLLSHHHPTTLENSKAWTQFDRAWYARIVQDRSLLRPLTMAGVYGQAIPRAEEMDRRCWWGGGYHRCSHTLSLSLSLSLFST